MYFIASLAGHDMPHATKPRVLFVDAYDSFTNNIVSLLESSLGVDVSVIKIDQTIADLATFLRPFVAVVAGPGPGHPQNPHHVGLFNEIWRIGDPDLVPVLGICLGFQSLVVTFGGKVEPLQEPRHGISRKIRCRNTSIFKGIDNIESIQYHSLHAIIKPAQTTDVFQNSTLEMSNEVSSCPHLNPLAWDLEDENILTNANLGLAKNPRSILMAVQHVSKPYYGIQFHPESVCSNWNARQVILNWWKEALKWNAHSRKVILTNPLNLNDNKCLEKSVDFLDYETHLECQISTESGKSMTVDNDHRDFNCQPLTHLSRSNFLRNLSHLDQQILVSKAAASSETLTVLTHALDLNHIDIASICKSMGLQDDELIILDSEAHQRPEVGTYSIIGIIIPTSLKLEYLVGTSEVRCVQGGKIVTQCLRAFTGSIFQYLKFFMNHYHVKNENTETPFWGGLMGYISYEACLETLDTYAHPIADPPAALDYSRPDLSFVFIERSIVIDHRQRKLYIQSIKQNDEDWIRQTATLLSQIKTHSDIFSRDSVKTEIDFPREEVYKSQIHSCQSSMRAGDAYELCLTAQSTIKTQSRLPAWPTYLRLRNRNPAPFCSYVRLGSLTLLSSSPERFLSWTRPAPPVKSSLSSNLLNGGSSPVSRSYKTSTCQFRPIKGTVKRFPDDPSLPQVTLAEAVSLLSTPKERAENLMIVDLIRHDIHGVVGPGNVHVRKLMQVEEYATLYQLVSVIEGTLHTYDDEINQEGASDTLDESVSCATYVRSKLDKRFRISNKTGIDVLAASLPPGSMTGAPKRRACSLLHALEARPRGVYSGVLGYLDVGGGGDFSVLIRSAFRWDSPAAPRDSGGVDEKATVDDEWIVGAGGAVTVLSTEDGEWDEMLAKLKCVVGIF